MLPLNDFARRLGETGMTETQLAVGLMWFHDRVTPGALQSSRDVAKQLNELALTAPVNHHRLARNLARCSDVVRDGSSADFRIKAGRKLALDQIYAELVGVKPIAPSDSLVPMSMFATHRKCWQQLVIQINGCYDCGYYDACAVLTRRLLESLIITAFKAKGLESVIQGQTGNMQLEELVGVLLSGNHIRLTKSGKQAVEPVRNLGNVAAHSPYHITTKQDVDSVAVNLRTLLSELIELTSTK